MWKYAFILEHGAVTNKKNNIIGRLIFFINLTNMALCFIALHLICNYSL
jgi:hypothetical protein